MGEDIVYPLANGSTGLIGWMQWVNHRNVNSSDLRYLYRFYYRIISNANVLINGIDNATGPKLIKKLLKDRLWLIEHGPISNLYNYGARGMMRQQSLTIN